MKCKIRPELFCMNHIKTGKGSWNYSGTCQNCEIFLKHKQTNMEINEMSKKQKISWINEKLDKIKQARKASLEAKGYKELLVFPVGETTITINLSKPPREVNTVNGIRDVLSLSEPKDKDLMLNPTTKFALQFYQKISEGQTIFTVVRTGKKKETRYAIKE